jgi:hypothetical protein
VWWTRRANAATSLGAHADADTAEALGLGGTFVEVPSGPLHLALLSSLLREKIIAPLNIKQLRRDHPPEIFDDYDDPDYTFNDPLASALHERKLRTGELSRLTELWPTDWELIFALYPQWDGEDETFDITSLVGLESCTNLELCHLERLDVRTLAPLAQLVRLRELNLSWSGEPPSLAPISQLVALEKLDLSQAQSLAELRGLPKLIELTVAHAELTGLSPLAKLPELKSLRIGRMAVPDTQLAAVKERNKATLAALAAGKVAVTINWPKDNQPKARIKRTR